MRRKGLLSLIIGLLALRAASAENLVELKGHVSKKIQSAIKLERVPADERVDLSLTLQLDQKALDQAIAEMYGPNAPKKRQYLTPSEFDQKFGLAEKRQKLKEFAEANGLTVDASDDRLGGMLVKVHSDAGHVENAFHVKLHYYRGVDGKIFRAHDSEPMVPESLTPHLSTVLGLSNVSGLLSPAARLGSSAKTSFPSSVTGSGQYGGLLPSDIKTIYGLNGTTLNGSGQSIALVELDGYIPSDSLTFDGAVGLAQTPVQFVGVDGMTDLCGQAQNQPCNAQTLQAETQNSYFGMGESALDIDMVEALAPNLSHIYLYEGPNTIQGIYDVYNKIATDNAATVVSTSWMVAEPDLGSYVQSEAQLFQRMALQGQTAYAASGDWGASSFSNKTICVNDPASQPYVTGVGGTDLSGTVGSPSETAWSSGGGGISKVWPTPSYQIGISGTFSQQFRNVPDVALDSAADAPYDIILGGTWWWSYGTSAASPLWAALTALANQQRAASGNGSLGFVNPLLYKLAATPSYHNLFNDVISGNNGVYSAGTGYDNVTGLGSFKGNALISALAGQPTAISQALTTAFNAPNVITLTGTDPYGFALTYSVTANPSHGSLSGTAPNLTYNPTNNYVGADSFSFKVNNGFTNSSAVAVSITVRPPPSPTASSQTITTSFNTAKAISLTGTDPLGFPLTYAVTANPSHGTLSGTAPNLTYQPSGYAGADSFRFNVNDGYTTSFPAVVSITVTAPPPPTASTQTVTTAFNIAKAITLTGTDPNGLTLTYTVTANPAHGSLTGTTPNMTYTPTKNYAGPDSFSFTANNGFVNSSTAAVVSITVSLPPPPTATAQGVATAFNTAKAITLTGTDPNGLVLTYTVIAGPAYGGKLTGTAPNLTYTPPNNYAGPDNFSFTVNNGYLPSNQGVIGITVLPPPAPTANAQTRTAAFNTATAITLTGTDPNGFPLTYNVTANPAHGTLTGTAPNLTYKPINAYAGPDSFIFTTNNGYVNSNPATITINVSLPPPPTPSSQTITAAFQTVQNVTLTGTDPNGLSLTFSNTSNPAHGTLGGVGASRTYTPNIGYVGADSFTFNANNGFVFSASAAVVSVTINPPLAPSAYGNSYSFLYNAASSIGLTGSDPTGLTLTYTITSNPAHGTLIGTAPNLTYYPNNGYVGPDSFTFKVSNGYTTSTAAVLSITVGAPPPPSATPLSISVPFNLPDGITLSGTDPNGLPITGYDVYATQAHGTLTGSGNFVTYTAAAFYVGSDSFTYSACNNYGCGTTSKVSITVLPTPPPTAVAQTVVAPFNTAKAITLTGTGTSGFSLTYALTSNPSHGILTGTAPNLTFTPASGYMGSDSFSFTVNNGYLSSTSSVVSISVLPPPPAVTSATNAAGLLGSPFTYTITATNNPTSFNAVGLPPGLIVSPQTGVISGTPTTVGTSSVTISATNAGGTWTAVLTLVVQALGSDTVWVEDSLPVGAGSSGDGGDAWNWVSANPAPFSGSLANQSNIASGEHQHYFFGATNTLNVNIGEALIAYVYLDPANPPSEIMLQWNDAGSWEHRAYWGADQIGWGSDGTVSRVNMGPLPAVGQWMRLSVPARAVGLEQQVINGMAFSLIGGRATWDHVGKNASANLPVITSATNATGTQGSAFTYAMTATNNPTNFGASGLPGGLAINSTTGLISGTPNQSGSFTVQLSATNSAGTSTASLSLNITSGCTPNPSCENSTCIGQTCQDSCGNSYPGTMNCAPPPPPQCTPNPSCANYTCMGQTCQDSCGYSYSGMMNCAPPPPPQCTPNSSCMNYTCQGQTCWDNCGNQYPGQMYCGYQGYSMSNTVAKTSSSGLSVNVHPNPWKPSLGVSSIQFDTATNESTIKIFTVSGHWVKTLSAPSGSVPWDLTNDSGERVASGIYIYLVTDPQGNKVHGKVVVIR